MDLDRYDLPYLLPYVLLDETGRTPSGKRQLQPMRGFWMSRFGKLRAIRGSDRRLRWCACIEIILTIDPMPIEKAAALVAETQGLSTAKEVATIRVAYYENRSGRNYWC